MKILIFEKKSNLKNTGGPTGYLYNISDYLDKHPQDEIEFLREEGVEETILSKVCTFFIKACISISKKYLLQHVPLVFSNFIYGKTLTKDSLDYLNQFDVIHVHAGPIMNQYFKKNKVKGRLVLTSHCPEPVIDEMSGKQTARVFYMEHPGLRNWILRQEVNVYDVCDNIMFPVPQAREPYEKASLIYKEKFAGVNGKFFYVPTALNSVDMIVENKHVLDKFNFNDSTLRVCYIGRHTEVKGYFFLKKAAEKCLKEIADVAFIIGGMKDCKIGLEDSRWHELGWVDTPSLLNEVDVFVLPNKNTYFDLILLEVLRQGTPVLLSRTGGNKWFDNKDLEGVRFFEYGNEKELVSLIKWIKELKEKGKLEEIKQHNRIFCQQQFNMKLYIERYLSEISGILKEKK